MYYDAHNHLQDEWLAPHLDRIAIAATDLPIRTMVVNGTCEADWPRVSALAQRFPFVRASYGLHPWDAGNRSPDWLDALRARLAAEPSAAVGEIGLDRWMTDSARADDPRLAGLRRASLVEQTEVFLSQLALATAENRPVTIHCLQAFGALDELLHAHPVPSRGFLLHAYGGPAEMVPRFAQLGAYFSFNGYFLKDTPTPITSANLNCNLLSYKPPKASRLEIFKIIPIDRLLVETDAPAMPLPQTWRTHKLPPAADGSSVNHPGNLDAAYAALASLRGLTLAELTAQVEQNFRRLFG
ncbi:TatD family hydrolase [Rariglobus hedericola]|uniref:TatD family deoxyribonuclease n=1 Tax=Rariglobus hedericola TaxID=2597822 RepID=A0A556QKP7_9BACT|nr:TatD family hydrolase [Rariglobus hedericola]TSJ77216.1 TatD family deoxyribonuclease [Rariglobus hedericola]